MKTRSRLLLFLHVAGLLMGPFASDGKPKEKAAAATAPEAVSRWESISYPVMTPWRKWITLPVLVPTVRVENKEKEGMILTLSYFLPSEFEQKKSGKVEAEKVTAELYRNQEKPVALKGVFDSHIYWGSGPEGQYRELATTHAFTIPWGPNAFDDAWVRLDLKDRVFWVELPYGFMRDPKDPPAPEDPKRESPKTTPFSQKKPGPQDLIIPWEYVSYRLGKFREGGSVIVNVANTFDAMTELVLWNFSGGVREPECTVANVIVPGYEKTGQCISLTLEKSSDPFRSQLFRYSRGSGDGRHWCQVRVTVEKEARTLTMPSSLVDYVHGHADVPRDVPQVKIAEKWWSRL
ncbi:MAG TPA: hypothetical protein VG796_13535 [Verrucomicrobiales bacterium]|nr:hypothetical protein [Verrucomicrobiales bacterium]